MRAIAEAPTTRSEKPMTVLLVAVTDADADTWISMLAFEHAAEQAAGLPKGTEIYTRGRLRLPGAFQKAFRAKHRHHTRLPGRLLAPLGRLP